MAAEGMQFSWRWTSGTFSTNLDVIWGMSQEAPPGVAGPLLHSLDGTCLAPSYGTVQLAGRGCRTACPTAPPTVVAYDYAFWMRSPSDSIRATTMPQVSGVSWATVVIDS